ncbi:MAG: carbohydrate ABC transporter permease [Alkalibacterium gilvum]|uniref:Carbohydrate ABC transporter membrane protein 2, CUT1 family (TC 3.A.1.1.-) n=1 Tax=Alkalibacterium gilvum TaxID=1130080 RepID=A0A1H6RCU1_9LACT|nr:MULTISPECIES: carbohydrate ABC transporter permease [Carnobacteriaceae]MDN6728636.1 carbohydrate ABC transporter permease [Alkalibacterium sp.]GEQ33745.1 sugar ABC transporter permease protein [Marinilactibacillus psychrotolerans]SEI53631.1 carbohydrate ABC transporter membrane protein 2, CUT1 family (TC 3.A.1.1.-) [Alkalibacterium gilvum]
MSAFKGRQINPKTFHKSQLKFYAVLIPLAIFMGLPIVYIFNHAFKPIDELFAFPPRFFVEKPTWQNFRNLFESTSLGATPMSRYLFNSIVVSLVVVVLTIIVATMAGYVLSKKQFRMKKALTEINTIALMFVATAVAIPRYFVIEQLGLINTFWVHILPALAMPVGLFLIKQFIDQIPDEMLEAAIMDGANDFQIYIRVILPMIKPAIATVAILAFQATWNNVEISDVFINNESLRTFAFYMSTLATKGNAVAGQGVSAAASLIMFIPNLVIFIFLQKQVMDTMAHSGIK